MAEEVGGVSDELKQALAMFSLKNVERAMVPVEDKQPDLEAAHNKAVSFFEDLNDVEQCVQWLEPTTAGSNSKTRSSASRS